MYVLFWYGYFILFNFMNCYYMGLYYLYFMCDFWLCFYLSNGFFCIIIFKFVLLFINCLCDMVGLLKKFKGVGSRKENKY